MARNKLFLKYISCTHLPIFLLFDLFLKDFYKYASNGNLSKKKDPDLGAVIIGAELTRALAPKSRVA
jgi:hypothetical protein